MLFVGLGMGLGHWLLLRCYLQHSAGWILATGLAMLLEGLFRMRLPPDTPLRGSDRSQCPWARSCSPGVEGSYCATGVCIRRATQYVRR